MVFFAGQSLATPAVAEARTEANKTNKEIKLKKLKVERAQLQRPRKKKKKKPWIIIELWTMITQREEIRTNKDYYMRKKTEVKRIKGDEKMDRKYRK